MTRQIRRWAPAPALLLLFLVAACSNTAHAPTDGENGADDGGPGGSASYEEAELTIAAELLDTGLLKGNATVEAAEGWRITALSVSATTPKGAKWGVIEFPSGIGSASGSEFFEVQVQELPRGDQLAVELHVTLESDDGQTVERTAVDHWPP
jgi:hypothetical protein